MVVTVQREVADRICAAPGTDAYGYLSVIVQAAARPKVLRHVRPGAFWPQPEVESSILRVRPDADLRAAAGDLGEAPAASPATSSATGASRPRAAC